MSNFFNSIVIYPLTQIIEFVFVFCNKIFGNAGFSLMGVSFAVSMLTLPLYVVAESWQQTERLKQAKMKPFVDRIKHYFKGNEQYMILTTYYSQNKYHPIMGLRSAFGLLIQIPFFTAAYTCISAMEAIKGKGFLFIDDMGSPDATFMLGTFAVNILPIAMTLINVVASAVYLKGSSIREKIQTYALAFIFLALLYNSPSGLVLYWTMNNIFSLVKNVFYRLKNPLRTLYWIFCALTAILIAYLIFGKVLAFRRALLICGVVSLVFFVPLIVKFCNRLVDGRLSGLRDNFRKRTVLFALSAAGIMLLLGFFIPGNLISSSPMEFSGIDGYGSPMFFIFNTFMQAVGFCFVWPFLIYFLFKERVQTLLSTGFFVLLLVSLLNCLVFSGNYGTLSKLLVFTDVASVDSTVAMIVLNLVAVTAVALVCIILFGYRISDFFACIAGMVCFVMLVSSFISFSTINDGYRKFRSNTAVADDSITPVFRFTRTGKNVLLVFLDRVQGGYIEPLFSECPELARQMTGFTFYRNTVSFNGHTLLASPACYGGYEYTPEEMNRRSEIPLVEKHNESALLLPRVFSEQFGYTAVVADPQWTNYSWIPDIKIYDKYPGIKAINLEGKYLDLWYREHQDTGKITVTSDTLKRNILWYGFFRTSMCAMRPAFYNSGKYWSTNTKNNDFDDYLGGYSTLEYLPRLSTFDNDRDSFITMTNESTHQSILLQPPEYRPSSSLDFDGLGGKYLFDDKFHCYAGAFKRLGEFFEILKKEGCYDNTKIILYSDHGVGAWEDDFTSDEKFAAIRPGNYHPFLMVKDFNETGALRTSDEFMTNADVPSIAVSHLEKAVNPYTGAGISSALKDNGALVCVSGMFMPHHIKSRYVFTPGENEWYRVKGDIFNSRNWVQEKRAE